MMISLDIESTGVDFFHGAKPFFVTICFEDGQQMWWDWSVDPLTRGVDIPYDDLAEIQRVVWDADEVIGQNIRFDVNALTTAGAFDGTYLGITWPWEKTHDTLMAGHLLASNQPHDLTALCIHYLGVDISSHENALEKVVGEARRHCQHKLKQWAIAKAGRPDMPSAKEKCWKYDLWLPKALAKYQRLPPDHDWWHLLERYSNADSAATLVLWKAMREHLEGRGLWNIYKERMKLPPIASTLERARGVSVSGVELDNLVARYKEDSQEAEKKCLEIAKRYNYPLSLPKSGRNQSLRSFIFDVLKLPAFKESKKTGAPSLDKETLDHWMISCEGEQLEFLRALRGKSKKDTAISYLESYTRFWLPLVSEGSEVPNWWVLHTNVNPTGTDHLRWSSSKPNSQNVSKQEAECEYCDGEGHVEGETCLHCRGSGIGLFSLRRTFGPGPGREWWSLDGRNLERRIPAYEAGEEEIISLFERPDDPPYYGSEHGLVAHILWPREFEACGDAKTFKKKYVSTLYQWTKNGDFAIQYGAQKTKADATYHKDGAFDLIKSRFHKQERLNQYWISFAERNGYVETVPDRSVDPSRGYPIMTSRTERGGVKPTIPLNYHTSGTACQWMAKAMIRCQGQLDDWNRQPNSLGYFMILQVHDELVFDFPRGGGPKPWQTNLPKARKIQALMEEGGDDIGIPTPCSLEWHGENWAEGKSF